MIDIKQNGDELKANGDFMAQGSFDHWSFSLLGKTQKNLAYWTIDWKKPGIATVHSTSFVSVIMSPDNKYFDGIWTSDTQSQKGLKGLRNGICTGIKI